MNWRDPELWLGFFVIVIVVMALIAGYQWGWDSAVRHLLTPDKKP